MSETRAARRGRGGGGGAAARRAARTSSAVVHLPYIRRKIATFDILHDEAMEIIETNVSEPGPPPESWPSVIMPCFSMI